VGRRTAYIDVRIIAMLDRIVEQSGGREAVGVRVSPLAPL
jgi:hypothetical protein